MTEATLSESSIIDRNVQQCPFPYYRLMHELDPVHYDAKADLYLVTRHDLLIEAARNVEIFSSEIDMRTDVGGPDTTNSDALFREKGWLVADVLSQVDPPRHTQFRAIVERLFTGPIVKRMETYIEAEVDRLIDAFIDTGEVDFYRQFAVPLPLGLIADQLGVPREDMEKFELWSGAIVETLGIMLSEERKLECTRLIIEFQHYFVNKMAERRESPQEDIISLIATARLDGEGPDLTTEERLALIQQLLVAGNETTRHHLAKCMLLLIHHPDQQALLRQDPSLIAGFVEESLRLEAPTQGLFRRVTRDYDLGGTVLPAGAKVMLLYGAANRDPSMFPQPNELDVTRDNARRHVAFGYGIHVCIGAMLARKELQVAYRRVLARMKNFALAEDHGPIEHLPSLILRSLKELRITFTPVKSGVVTASSKDRRG
jgi:cytochrome P450